MPQITCPNCGKTINLESRKKIDYSLIQEAVSKKPRTFGELLNITKLPRKTLSLRLKDLCASGVISKINGVYTMNGHTKFEMPKTPLKHVSKILEDRKLKIGLTLAMFLLSSSILGYVFAMFINPPPATTPKALGNLTMALHVNDVEDLYSWQAIISFNPNQMNVANIVPGEFFKVEYPFFLNVTDISKGVLLVGGTLVGETSGKSGSGTLAIILFEYFVEEYEMPHLVLSEKGFATCLYNSKCSVIPINSATILSLTVGSE